MPWSILPYRKEKVAVGFVAILEAPIHNRVDVYLVFSIDGSVWIETKNSYHIAV
jgi:hypothetical protein